MLYKNITLLTVLLLIFSLNISGQQFSEKRTYRKSLPVNNEMTLEINNKYGTVHISSSNVDSVKILAEIEAVSPRSDRLTKMLEGISINISETNYLIRVQTDFSQTINMIFESFKGMTNKLIPYDSRIQINYFIESPEYMNIRISNKYGDVYLENLKGNLSVDMSNGSFKANSLDNNSQLNLNFCNATINSVRECKIDASFSEVVVGESDELSITSVSTRFDLKKNNAIVTKSRRDKFYIGNVNDISGNSYFTDYRIEDLGNEVNLEAKYGTIDINKITKSCELINLNTGYTDIYLNFDPSLSYNLDIKHTNAFLSLPEDKTFAEKKTVNEDKKEYMTFGTVGKNKSNLKVIIEATRGNISLR